MQNREDDDEIMRSFVLRGAITRGCGVSLNLGRIVFELLSPERRELRIDRESLVRSLGTFSPEVLGGRDVEKQRLGLGGCSAGRC